MTVGRLKGPLPSPGFTAQMIEISAASIFYCVSGEVTMTKASLPLGVAGLDGKVAQVFMSVAASGKDDSNTLSIEGDVKVNGTSCLSTKPKIAHVSGEASQHKTTAETGDTGITQAVIDSDEDVIHRGDILTCDFTLDRTASPTTEIKHPCIVVEIEPSKVSY